MDTRNIDQITKYWYKYEPLVSDVSQFSDIHDPTYKLGMNGFNYCEVTVNIVDEEDYYGCDFSGAHQVLQIGFTGSSDFFPAIVLGANGENVDELPIYYFDLSNYDATSIKTEGNFKTYMTDYWGTILTNIKAHTTTEQNQKIVLDLQNAIADLAPFSNNLISSENFLYSTINIEE